jgi:hypothetical protein
MLLGVILVPCHKDVTDHSCPFLVPRWLQGDYRENGLENDRYKMEGRCHAFLLLLVNSWAQEGVSAFSTFTVSFLKIHHVVLLSCYSTTNFHKCHCFKQAFMTCSLHGSGFQGLSTAELSCLLRIQSRCQPGVLSLVLVQVHMAVGKIHFLVTTECVLACFFKASKIISPFRRGPVSLIRSFSLSPS